MKRCTKCGEYKHIESFSKKIKAVDGLQGWCKKCSSATHKVWADKNKTSIAKRHKEWGRANRNKIAAYTKVSRARKSGDLIAQPCEVCGSDESEAHHEDYTEPLNVIWLCKKHHAERHQSIGAIIVFKKGENQMANRIELMSRGDNLAEKYSEIELKNALATAVAIEDNEERLALQWALKQKSCTKDGYAFTKEQMVNNKTRLSV